MSRLTSTRLDDSSPTSSSCRPAKSALPDERMLKGDVRYRFVSDNATLTVEFEAAGDDFRSEAAHGGVRPGHAGVRRQARYMSRHGRDRLVAMPLIPGTIRRGGAARASLDYAPYSIATWKWWCAQNRIDFHLIEEVGQTRSRILPPTFQRWVAAAALIAKNQRLRILMVDADTMIRWDAPSPFGLARHDELGVVRDSGSRWIYRSVTFHQPLFPNTALPWWHYFNTGVVLLSRKHLPLLESLLGFAERHWETIAAIQQGANVGTDQTLMNFIVQRDEIPIRYLPPTYNFVHCVPLDGFLTTIERAGRVSQEYFSRAVARRVGMYIFTEMSYVWHFTNVVHFRKAMMRDTWLQVAHHYAGANPSAT